MIVSHLLNFREGEIASLPEWFELRDDLKAIAGPGDYVHYIADLGRYQTNVEKYIDYDIFCCFGDDDIPKVEGSQNPYTSVADNVKYLEELGANKLVCIIDLFDTSQTDNFVRLFGRNFAHINNQDAHSPPFPPSVCGRLLKPGGFAIAKGTYWNGKATDGFTVGTSRFVEPGTGRVFPSIKTYTYTGAAGGRRRRQGKTRRKVSGRRRHTRRR
jgi:hypothetical protein